MSEFDYLFDAEGEPEQRFLPVEQILVPDEVELSVDGSELEVPDYEDYFYGAGRHVTVTGRTLLAFLNLGEGDTSAAAICRFAQKWGLLGLCEHGQPAAGHGLEPREARLSSRASLLPSCQEHYSETISNWRRYAQQFATILKLGDALRQPRSSDTGSLWERLPVPPFYVSRAREQGSTKERQLLVSLLNALLAATTIQPTLSWDRRAILQFGCRGGTTLIAALTFELAMAVADSKTAFCSYCHRPYQPNRRPRAGEANSCKDCRQTANAARVQRSRALTRAKGK